MASSLNYMARSFLNILQDYASDKKILQYSLIFLLLVSSGIGVYFGYRWYASYREQAAQLAFGITLDQYNDLLEKEDADFVAIAQEFAQGYKNHKNSSLAPYFLSAQADALIKAGDKKGALAVMDTLVDTNQAHAPMMALFKTKRALLALDSGDETRTQKSLDELETVAQDTTNIYRDYALYHLGMYHWVHNNIEAAKKAWQELVAIEQGDAFSVSPWAALVSDTLQSIS